MLFLIHVQIDKQRLIDKRVLEFETVDQKPTYLLILDLTWTTGGAYLGSPRATPSSFIDDNCDFGVVLKLLKQSSSWYQGRKGRQATPKPYVSIIDEVLIDRTQSYRHIRRSRP